MSTESGKSTEACGEKKSSEVIVDISILSSIPSGSCPENQHLSKNQLKKQKKKEKWLQIKADKRKEEKQKRKRKYAEMKERGEGMGPSRKSLKKRRMVDSSCKLRVVIDCSFDEYMSEKDASFLVQQIQHSYAANRRAQNPLQLYICGISGKAKKRLDNIGDYKGWDLYKAERNYTEVFPKDEVVYLSSESPNILDRLDDSKVYVIGGLVDHNHYKGLCHKLAEEKGLAHAQLPLGQFLQLKSRKVLTINHVFEILLRFTETNNWQSSFLSVLPQRKGVSVKESGDAIAGGKINDTAASSDNTKEELVSPGHCADAVTDGHENSGSTCEVKQLCKGKNRGLLEKQESPGALTEGVEEAKVCLARAVS